MLEKGGTGKATYSTVERVSIWHGFSISQDEDLITHIAGWVYCGGRNCPCTAKLRLPWFLWKQTGETHSHFNILVYTSMA